MHDGDMFIVVFKSYVPVVDNWEGFQTNVIEQVAFCEF